jgi:tripartite-type tricarboxylate transporter receptor subunit TctC
MRFRLSVFSLTAVTAILLAPHLFSAEGLAQSYPTKTIRVVVPYGPGGASDQLARAVAEELSKRLGQSVVIDNRPGGGTIIGTDFVAKAAPDGYTVGFTTFASLVSNPVLVTNLPYKADKDFEGVSLLASSPMVLMVTPDLPVKNVSEFIGYAKANPDKINYGSSGPGSTVHLAAELFKSQAGIKMVHVPFKSSPEVLNAMAGGFVQAAFDLVITAKPQIESGKLRALAISDSTRSALMPDLPTVAEAGVPGYEAATWYGFIVPKQTPQDIIARLNKEVRSILSDDGMRAKFAKLGMDLKASSPNELMELAARERTKWRKIVAEQGITRN